MMQIACDECFVVTRVESIGPSVATFEFCPVCGHTAHVSRDLLIDYWLTLALSLGLPYNNEGAGIARDIFDTWDKTEYNTFKEYVHALRTTG